MAADPAVCEQHPSKDRTEEHTSTRWFDDALACGGALVAVDRATGGVFGTSHFVLHGPDEAEIGWTFLARSRWGGLWNGEMKRLLLKHAFDKVQQVRFTVHPEDTRLQRAVKRLGAVPSGTAPDAHGRGEMVAFHLSWVAPSDT